MKVRIVKYQPNLIGFSLLFLGFHFDSNMKSYHDQVWQACDIETGWLLYENKSRSVVEAYCNNQEYEIVTNKDGLQNT